MFGIFALWRGFTGMDDYGNRLPTEYCWVLVDDKMVRFSNSRHFLYGDCSVDEILDIVRT